MARDTRQEYSVHVAGEPRLHRPEHVVGVEQIDILVDQDDVLELAVDAERDDGGLPGHAIVRIAALPDLEDGKEFASTGAVCINVLEQSRQRILHRDIDARLGRNARHADMLFARTDQCLQNRVPARGDCLDLDDRKRWIGVAGVAGNSGIALPVWVC